MRFVSSMLVLCFCALVSARAQNVGDLFATPTPAPVPAVQALSIDGVANGPGVASVASIPTITLSAVTTPSLFASFVSSASSTALLAVLNNPATTPEILGSLLTATDAPTRTKVFTALLSAPTALVSTYVQGLAASGTLASSLSGVSSGTLFSLLVSVSDTPTAAQVVVEALEANGTLTSTINSASTDTLVTLLASVSSTTNAETLQSLLQSISDAGQLQKVTETYFTARFFDLNVSYVKPIAVNVLIAVANFAAQDPRFDSIAPYSYYGQKLRALRDQIKQEGETSANQAQMAQLYQEAASALQKFLAAEKAEQADAPK